MFMNWISRCYNRKIVPNSYDMHTHLPSSSEWNYLQPKLVPEGSTSCCRLHREFFLYFVEFQKLAYIKLTKSELRSNINLKCRTSVCHLRKGSFSSGPVNIISTARFLETSCLTFIIGEEDNSFITSWTAGAWFSLQERILLLLPIGDQLHGPSTLLFHNQSENAMVKAGHSVITRVEAKNA